MKILKIHETDATYHSNVDARPEEHQRLLDEEGYKWSTVSLHTPDVPDGEVVAWVVNPAVARVLAELWNARADFERKRT